MSIPGLCRRRLAAPHFLPLLLLAFGDEQEGIRADALRQVEAVAQGPAQVRLGLELGC